MPTFIVHGDADESVPYAQSVKLVSLLEHGELKTVHGADHRYTNPEHAKQMIRYITDFVTGHV
jgi:dipeptidyl aminopeptidase/acylaminoacyl peptidase